MKLLTISNCPLVAHQGSGYVALGYVHGLRELGWTVDAFGSDEIEPWRHFGRARSWRIALGMMHRALQSIREVNYDIVEFYGGEAWLAISALARTPGRRFLLVSHSNGLEPFCSEQLRRGLGVDTLDGRPRRWFQIQPDRLLARGFRTADALVTVSHFDLGYASQHGYQPAGRMLAIENPLPEQFLSLPLELDRPLTIGYCGSWIERKGVGLVAKDMAQLLGDFPQWRLRLIGVGASYRVEDHFPESVRAQIEVLPFIVDKETLRSAYTECAILVAPSVYESFGMVVAEAMACGCAVVAGCTGFAAGLRDGTEASVLPEIRSPHLYDKVRDLIIDPVKRRELAAGGYRHVQRLNWKSAVSRLASAYETWHQERRLRTVRAEA
jgi:glycosyltransferase involved in cell wall biosynthesis